MGDQLMPLDARRMELFTEMQWDLLSPRSVRFGKIFSTSATGDRRDQER
jgi:hypothetical protein